MTNNQYEKLESLLLDAIDNNKIRSFKLDWKDLRKNDIDSLNAIVPIIRFKK